MPYLNLSPDARGPIDLVAYLKSFDAPTNSLFALIDVGNLDEGTFDQVTKKMSADMRAVNLYDDLGGLEIANLGPRLVALPANQPISPVILDLAANSCAVSFLWSAASHRRVAEHLRDLREVSLADGEPVLFRFQDTRVLSALFPILPPHQHDRFLGPLRRWSVAGACLDIHALEHPVATKDSATLILDAATTEALDEALFEQTVAAQITETDSALLSPLSACQRHERITRHLEHGRKLGLSERSDLSLYCILAFQLPEGFERSGPFARALRFSESGYASFGDALDAATREEWEIWDVELNR